jgi:hypothetical protein
MAARTTDANVRAIIETDEDITDLSPFIDMANELTTECCGDAGYSDSRLEYIERLLAAHFYCLRDTRFRQERAGSVGATYDTKLDLFLGHTHHGQMAMIMDTAGGLAKLMEDTKDGGKVAANMLWLGTEQTNTES